MQHKGTPKYVKVIDLGRCIHLKISRDTRPHLKNVVNLLRSTIRKKSETPSWQQNFSINNKKNYFQFSQRRQKGNELRQIATRK